jgi:prepilin-type N-terminal cleavage/methylation domain-containing protein
VTRRTSLHDGFTLIELVVVIAVIAIIAAIAIPGLLRVRMSGNEASAIGSLRSIDSGESTYAASCGSGGYAQSLQDLSKPPVAGTGFISPDMTGNGMIKSGYVVNVGPGTTPSVVTPAANTCNLSSGDALATFFAETHPVTVGTTGQRSFGTDQRFAIYDNKTGTTFTAATTAAANTPIQ